MTVPRVGDGRDHEGRLDEWRPGDGATMVTPATQRAAQTGDPIVCAQPDAEQLVRLLVDAALRGGLLDVVDELDPDVVLDLELDGYRCTVRRTAPDVDGEARSRLGLTPREQEIARMVAGGYPNKTIARVLDISAWTVGTHLRRMFLKLGVTSRAAMVARLVEEHPQFARSPSRHSDRSDGSLRSAGRYTAGTSQGARG
jgi:DNA-binding CsgD family transcriptional regulator